MTTIIDTNAKALFDADGDFVGYALPEADPVSIDTKWTKSYRSHPFEDVDELVYVVRWADGTFADMFTIPNRWNDIFHAGVNLRHRAAMNKLDVTLGAAA